MLQNPHAPASSAPTPATSGAPTSAAPSGAPTSAAAHVDWRAVGIFFVIALAIMALMASPFWILEEGIRHPLYSVLISVAMFAPATAAILVTLTVQKVRGRAEVLPRLGLAFRGRWRRIGVWSAVGLVVVLAINVLTAVILVLRGVPGDLTGGTWARTLTQQLADAGAPMPTPAAVLLVLGGAAVGLVLTVIPCLGEEIGWRGWLWQQLRPLGYGPAVAAGGTIWALWHLPVLLIGHNYPGMPRGYALGMFILFCTGMNALLGALTERAGGNVIPAAVAHSTMNSTLGLAIGVVGTAETAAQINWYIDTALGVTGIVLISIAASLLMPGAARRRFGRSSAAAAGPTGQAGPTPETGPARETGSAQEAGSAVAP